MFHLSAFMYIKTERRMKGNCRKNTSSMSFGASIDSIVVSFANHARTISFRDRARS